MISEGDNQATAAPIPNDHEGRTGGREANSRRRELLRHVWGDWLDDLKRQEPEVKPEAAGCRLYLWWVDGGKILYDHIPGKKRAYSHTTIIEFACEWATTSRAWRY